MASYELRFKRSVTKDLRGIPAEELGRILTRVEALVDQPRPAGCEKIGSGHRYRIRQGAYRVLYEVDDAQRVVMEYAVGHRRDVHRR